MPGEFSRCKIVMLIVAVTVVCGFFIALIEDNHLTHEERKLRMMEKLNSPWLTLISVLIFLSLAFYSLGSCEMKKAVAPEVSMNDFVGAQLAANDIQRHERTVRIIKDLYYIDDSEPLPVDLFDQRGRKVK